MPQNPALEWNDDTGFRPMGRTGVMGILNVTPDSFSDGGELGSVEVVVARARKLIEDGACLLDVGGESTRPGAAMVSIEEELRRTIPAIRALKERLSVPISVDTRKAAVLSEAAQAGAAVLNDVSGLQHDPEMTRVAARTGVNVIIMHARGTPATMDALCTYADPVADTIAELRAAVFRAESAGVRRQKIWVDPGLGFAKTAEQSWEIVRRISEFSTLGRPMVVGPSRKRFLGQATGRNDPKDRDIATAVVVSYLARLGVAFVRTHDVRSAVDAVATARALDGPAWQGAR